MTIPWTVEQEKFLRENINSGSLRDLGKRCGHPSKYSVRGAIERLGLRRCYVAKTCYNSTWTAEQETLLRENINAMPVRELGVLCGHPKTSTVWNRIRRLGLDKDSRTHDYRNKFPKMWTDEQEQFLREHKDDMTLRELGKHCGNRCTQGVTLKLRLMGLKKKSFAHVTRFQKGHELNTKFKIKHLLREDILSVYPKYPAVVARKKLGVCQYVFSREMERHKINKATCGYYTKGKPKPASRERMNRLWRTGYFANKFYPFVAPNKAEDKLLAVIQELGLPFRYVGDWKYQVGTKNPDFVHLSKPVCIDLFGSYWHSAQSKSKDKRSSYLDAGVRKQEFADNGHDLLVIYEKELRDLESLRNKLVEYANA